MELFFFFRKKFININFLDNFSLYQCLIKFLHSKIFFLLLHYRGLMLNIFQIFYCFFISFYGHGINTGVVKNIYHWGSDLLLYFF
jgi:hypothetical protein